MVKEEDKEIVYNNDGSLSKGLMKVFEYDIYECPEELKGQLKIGDFFG